MEIVFIKRSTTYRRVKPEAGDLDARCVTMETDSHETSIGSPQPRQQARPPCFVKSVVVAIMILAASVASLTSFTSQVWNNLHSRVFGPRAVGSRSLLAALRLTDAKTVIFVLSRVGAFDVRQSIRETWAAGQDNVYFVVGQPCNVHRTLRGVQCP
jgi:hypothetical protein